jgi:hypothetical protein
MVNTCLVTGLIPLGAPCAFSGLRKRKNRALGCSKGFVDSLLYLYSDFVFGFTASTLVLPVQILLSVVLLASSVFRQEGTIQTPRLGIPRFDFLLFATVQPSYSTDRPDSAEGTRCNIFFPLFRESNRT